MLRIRSPRSAVLALTLVAGVALAGRGFAWPGGGPGGGPAGGPGPHGRFLERQLDALNLPADTRAKIQAVLDASRPGQQALHQQMRTAHESMRALLEADPVDEQAVMTQADSIGALMTQSRKQELATLIQVRGLLTSDQRALLDQQMQEHHARGWHGAKGGDCPCAQGPAAGGAPPAPTAAQR